jgi:long-chain acyl-CoA synthetase
MHTIQSLLKESCLKYSDKAAMVHKVNGTWQEISYGELWRSSDRIAAGLLKGGFKPGQHAAILAPSSPRWVFAYLGVLKAGGVVVPIDKELKSAELRHILTDSDAAVIFTDLPYLDAVLECLPSLTLPAKVIMLHPAPQRGDDPRTAKTLEDLLQEWQSLVSTCDIPEEKVVRLETLASQVHRLFTSASGGGNDKDIANNLFSPVRVVRKELVKQGRLIGLDAMMNEAPLPESSRTPGDIAVILYTSGTTGRSKGAMLSHSNIVSNIKGAAAHFYIDETIHTLSFLPINHVFEQVVGILLPLAMGGKVTFSESLKKLGENLAEVKPSFFLGVPAVYRMILDRIRKNIEGKTLSQLLFAFPVTRPLIAAKVRQAFGSGTIFISGGAPLDPAIAQGLESLGISIYQGYGITETSPIISAEQPRGKKIGTVGRMLPEVQVRIDNPNDDNVGEIIVRGPNVMQGYYKNPVATSEVLQDGWYRTGDLGRLDSDGCLTISGRVKNLIVTPNGKNVYPEEVENELLKSPYIAEVMVYGHKVDPMAEEVHAMIYPVQEELDNFGLKRGRGPMTVADVEALIREEVLAACKELADYKRVKKFTIREDDFPKTTTRKIKRFAVEASISTRD